MNIIKSAKKSDLNMVALVQLATVPDCFGVAKYQRSGLQDPAPVLLSVAWSTEKGARSAYAKAEVAA